MLETSLLKWLFLCPICLDHCVSIFTCLQVFLNLLIRLFNSMLFSLNVFVVFAVFFLCLISTFILLWSKKMLDMFSIFFNLLICFFGLACDLSWRMFHVLLKRMCISLLLDGMLYIYPSNSHGLM